MSSSQATGGLQNLYSGIGLNQSQNCLSSIIGQNYASNTLQSTVDIRERYGALSLVYLRHQEAQCLRELANLRALIAKRVEPEMISTPWGLVAA